MTLYLTSPLFLISLSYALSLLLTVAVRSRLIKRELLDHPNERSSHNVPIPRGGGLALLLVLIPGMIIMGLLFDRVALASCVIAGTVLLALVSWRDDRLGVSPVKRLSLHIAAACIGSLAFTHDQTLFNGALPFWLDRTLMIVGWAWFMNLYNFMDGIDGITCSETIALATGSCLLMTAVGTHEPFLSTLTLLLTGTCLGFLALNWQPAKIFMGDIGSVPLGFLTGFILLSLATRGFLIPALILPLYYLADSGITLIKRVWRREKIWQAHRQHFYQRATQQSGRHDQTVVFIIITNIGLISAALTAVSYPKLGSTLAVVAVAILLGKLHKTGP